MIPIGTWRTSLEVLVVCGAFAACAGALPTTPGPLGTATIQTAKHAELGQEFQLRNTESTAIGPDGLTLRFDRVTRDERCPIGHRCTVEGDAVVEVTLRQAGN